MIKKLILSSALACSLTFASPAWAVDDFRTPEARTHSSADTDSRLVVHGQRYMVSAANPLAAQAGADVLKSGGNAVDAAIATQLVLNIVEPQSSGIGGGGFMLYWDATARKLHVYDGRETAPAAVNESLFLDAEGKPVDFDDAMKGGHAVGTPGLLKMLDHAHQRHGKTEWEALFADALRLTRDGFPMSERLHLLLSSTAHIRDFSASMQPFSHADGTLKSVGETITNQALHDTLARIASEGTQVFYEGDIAEQIVEAVRTSPHNPGQLSMDDLRHYTVKEREPVCAPYRAYKICSMPPPSSGGVTILQALGILASLPAESNISKTSPISVKAVHLFTEASKLAYADRNRYLADPDFVDVPVDSLLHPNYLAGRAQKIHPHRASSQAKHGVIQGYVTAAMQTTEEHPSTTHISIIDAQGNAVSMTTSIEQGFGSGLSAAGFLLNNQMTDFNFVPTLGKTSYPHPNRIEPKKRPRSSMSPTMVFDENDQLVMVIGSPGGARIIQYVLQTLLGVIDWRLDIQQAMNLPHYLNMNGPTELEAKTPAAGLEDVLRDMGHDVVVMDSPSGLHGITRFDGTLAGGADYRREGVAIGE